MSVFMDTVLNLREGGAIIDLDEQIDAILTEVQRTGQSGALSLQIKIEPGGDDVVILKDEIKATLPKKKTATTRFYVTPENRLSRRHPQQMELSELRDPVRG